MAGKLILVGVDGSPESLAAAKLAVELAGAAGADCKLVHVVTDFWLWSGMVRVPADAPGLTEEVVTEAREKLQTEWKTELPERLLRGLEVEIGRAARILADAAARHRAELVVLGGKRHTALARGLGGSTARDLLRLSTVPLWVSAKPGPVERILAALDLSEASGPTLAAAESYAQLLGARLRVLHVVEPPPEALSARSMASIRPRALDLDALREPWEKELERLRSGRVEFEPALRSGHAAETIATEAEESRADLVVLGSHGRGWVDRALIGSTTERVLRLLPTSLLIVPKA